MVVVGEVGVPAVGGMALGYWASDLGLPWMPDALALLAVYALVSATLVIGGHHLRGRLYQEAAGGRQLRTRAILSLGIVGLAGLIRLGVWHADTPSPLTELSDADYAAAVADDLERYADLERGLESLMLRLERPGVVAPGADGLLSLDQERLLRDAWSSFYAQAFVLDQIRAFHEDFYRFDPSRLGRPKHLQSFLLTLGCEASQVEKGHRFARLVADRADITRFLDAPDETRGLPANTWSTFRQQTLGSADQSRLQFGQAYLSWLRRTLSAEDEARSLGLSRLWGSVQGRLARLREMGLLDKAEDTLRGESQGLKRTIKRVWYPAQSGFAEWLGDTRVRRIGKYLVPHAQVELMEPALEPGDVMVSRKNWYLSNVGLPGFWPHAILYVGSPAKLSAFFDQDPAVAAWVESLAGPGVSYSEWLSRRFPLDWAHHVTGVDGHEARVIEAISDGVVLNSMDHAAGDYLAALRPRLDRLARAQAIASAYEMLGRPYDFDFDFATDHAIVCSELVWRAYRPAEGKSGLDIPTIDVVGRSTLPANELIRMFAEQRGSETRAFDFVWFVDAIEAKRSVVVSDEASLAASWQRAKWDIAQK